MVDPWMNTYQVVSPLQTLSYSQGYVQRKGHHTLITPPNKDYLTEEEQSYQWGNILQDINRKYFLGGSR
jgi:hypothetical protein